MHINPSYFRQLPIYPADAHTQVTLLALVDEILAKNVELNKLREQDYIIRQRRNGTHLIDVPYDVLLNELQKTHRNFPTITFFDARAIGLFSIPERCDIQTAISSNIYISDKYPTSIVLRHNKLWLEVPDDNIRHYLLGYLKRPKWQGKTWDEIKNIALIPEDADLNTFFATEARKMDYITAHLAEIRRIDREIDDRVLDLYGIMNAADRQRVLGSAPIEEEEDASNNEASSSSPHSL